MSTTDVEGCLACDLSHGRVELPGGTILASEHWRVEHCVGPLCVGTLLLKPLRHVLRVSQLSRAESMQLGPLLQACAAIVDALVRPEQVYTCLWSHANAEPVHLHWVIQPITADLMHRYGAHGPSLQVAMFQAGVAPDPTGVSVFADAARQAFAAIG